MKDFDKILQIMRQCDSCVLALNDDGFPYMVPLNFGMDIEDGQLYLYFHCAMQGKKLDLIRKDNRATFEMDCDHNFILYDERMSCTMGYSSVVGHGIIEFVEEEKKYEALKILMRQYHAEDFQFNKDMIKVTTVLKMKVLDITGKHRNNIH
ncbi:pyridoxamine 5'-phosphate oxidase family protein [Faecalicoccus pleomorphus]|uniref:pyridoxamine 5'-phosphate oxidase family protein n=1 Tax=Faecalicoccus pleomorphus TaxID=1323 RepID=UPI00242D8FDA|nr:pyridoxamine 5'-phosphate oxidase family protein [Faecalicoccus pleomorphus]